MEEKELSEIMADVVNTSSNGRIDGESGSTRVITIPGALQLVAEAYQAGMNYAFEKALQLTTTETYD